MLSWLALALGFSLYSSVDGGSGKDGLLRGDLGHKSRDGTPRSVHWLCPRIPPPWRWLVVPLPPSVFFWLQFKSPQNLEPEELFRGLGAELVVDPFPLSVRKIASILCAAVLEPVAHGPAPLQQNLRL